MDLDPAKEVKAADPLPSETENELSSNEETVENNENDAQSQTGNDQEDEEDERGDMAKDEEGDDNDDQEAESGNVEELSDEGEEESNEGDGLEETEEAVEEEDDGEVDGEEDGEDSEGQDSKELPDEKAKEPTRVPVQTPDSAKLKTGDIGMSPDEREKQQDEKFEQLEKEFQKTFFDMAMDESATKYRTEFDKIHRTLLKYRENEKRLVKKCKDLNGEMVANAEKVQAALKLSQNDRSTIATLKKEIKKAWKMVETSNEKEARAKDAVSQMKQEVSTLGTQGEAQYFMSPNQEKSLNDLIAAKEELMKERDQMNAKLEGTVSELTTAQDKLAIRNTEHSEMEHEINTLKDLIATKKSESDREARSREKLEKELREVKAQSEQKSAEYKIQQGTIAKYKEELSKFDVLVREQKQTVDKASKDQDNLAMRNQKLQMDYEEQILSTTQLLSENQSQALELKIREDDFLKLKEEVKNINRVKDSLAKKAKSLEENKEQAERERDSLKSLNYSLEREQLQAKQQGEADRKQIDELVRERDILNKNFIKSTGATTKQANLVKLHEQTKRNLEQEIQGYKDEASKQRKLIYALEKDRDRHINESAQNQAVAQSHLEEVKIKELQLFDYKKKITEAENKLKQQQQLYENARSDRNLYSKNLIESQDEIIEMKRKLKIMNHQIDQLKEEITAKEAALVKEHFEHLKVEKEKDGVKMELTKLKQQNDLAQQYIQSQQAEEHKLRHIITEADAERLRQKKEYDAVIQERDILGTQLIRRNDELALVYEKIKIQQSTLNKGEIQYRERLEDIRVLKLEIKKLRREKVILQHETANVEQLRNEIYRLQRELLRERTRVKVLEEELENPINIHRWRKLEGSDPSTFEMVQKVQTLQKRLIAKTEEVVEKELMIQAREKMYQNLKSVLVRCPGPEVAEQITVYQQNLKEKTSQVKALASELNMHQAQGSEFKYEIERLNHELVEVKKRYYEQKRKEQQARFAAPMEIVPRAKTWAKGVALGAAS